MSVTYRPGTSWTDVIWTGTRFVRANAGLGSVEFGWESDWQRIPVPQTDILRYLRIGTSPAGVVAAIGAGGDDRAYLVTDAGVVADLGSCFGQNGVGLYHDMGEWVPVIQRSPTHYSVGDVLLPFPPDVTGTSQGFRDVLPDGTIIFGDDALYTTIGGVTLHKPNTRGHVTVGQINGTDQIDGVLLEGLHFQSIPGKAFEPHVAWDGGAAYAIVARTGSGAALNNHPPYPPAVDPDVEPPSCTIASYPMSVVQGDPCVATAHYSGGPTTTSTWLYKLVSETIWITAAVQTPPGASFDYGPSFTDWGHYHIALRVVGPGGTDETVRERVITVLERPASGLQPPVVTVDRWTLDDVLEGREFTFHDRGNPDLQLGVRVWVQGGSMYASLTNAAGSAQTGLPRPVHPCSGTVDPDPDPDPIVGRRPVSFGPNLGSGDFRILFTEPEHWTGHTNGLGAFHFYGQNVLPIMQELVGENTYEGLRDAGAFRHCKEWGFVTEMELAGGPEQAYEAEARIASADGRLDLLAYDDTFDHISVEDFAAWVREYRTTRPKWTILVYVAFPMVSVDQIMARVNAWKALGGLPDGLRMDVDPGLPNSYTAADHARLRAFCDAEGLALQYVCNAKDGLTDLQYCQQTEAKHTRMEALGHWDGRIVQSWAANPPEALRHTPKNLREGDPAAFTTTLKRILDQHPPIVPPVQPVEPVVKLTTDRQIFRREGVAWRYKGVTAFKLARLHADGQNIDDFLAAYAGFNVLRIFDYAVVNAPGFQWESPSIAQTQAFLSYVGARGFHVEHVLLTDDNPARHAHARELAAALGVSHPGTFLEIGNEPNTNKHIDTSALKAACEASGLLFSSGDYDDSPKQFGPFLTYHSARDSEWPRKAHDAIEYYGGGGPNAPTDPAHHTPAVADEPIRPDQVNPAWWDMEQDFVAYFATASLLGAGGTFHSETGKYGNLPTDLERRMAAAALRGLDHFPTDAPLAGPYERIDEHGATLRTYKIGPHIVRIRPQDGIVFP